jgi:hypothetical protein
MSHSITSRLLASYLAVGVAAVFNWGSAWSGALADEPAQDQPVYHIDPDHLWNRLYDGLFVRVGPDGGIHGHDRFEPLLWLASKHLLEGPSHDRAVKLLQEFNDKEGEKLIEDPLKRALLQRDLWMAASWLEGAHTRSGESGVLPEKLREARRRLGPLLAAAIRRLALRLEQVKKLPDNYAQAVKSGRFAKSQAEEKPDRPYLPGDLFSADGPWICVGRSDRPVATQHLQETNTLANSAFLIFLRLPGGRDAALRHLKHERGELPVGAEVALVRRALAITSPAEITPTTLIETLQLRVYGESELSVSEFRLSRRQLFAGKAGGLRAVGSDERDFKTGFAAQPWDPLEDRLVDQPLDVRRVSIKSECTACHNPDRFSGLRARESGPLSETPVADAMTTALKWKQDRSDWKALRKLLVD